MYLAKLHIKRKVFLFLSILLAIGLYIPTPVYSDLEDNPEDFTISVDYAVLYDGGDSVKVSETRQIRVNNPQYYLAGGEEIIFLIPDYKLQYENRLTQKEERDFKLTNLKVTNASGNLLNYKKNEQDKAIEIRVPYSNDITVYSPVTVNVEYFTHELVNINGNISNLFVPGLKEDTKFTETDPDTGLTTRIIYNTTLSIKEDLPEVSYISIDSIEPTGENGRIIYKFSSNERTKETLWVQLGKKQYYYFEIIQKTPKTDTLIPKEISKYSKLISTNIVKIPLPKEHSETGQQVFFSEISPNPIDINRDQEGNLTASFEVPANEESEIIINGYIVLEYDEPLNRLPDRNLDQYLEEIRTDPKFKPYTNADIYWESDSASVQELASKLKKNTTTLQQLIKADYHYIIDSFEYSEEKSIGENKRHGALAAFNGAESVCMEYADAMIALLRAQGVPARAAIGYGNDPTGIENEIGTVAPLEQKIGHQWLQVWVPDYGWMSVDPTWGETGRTYIGGNLDHLLWYTVGSTSEERASTELNTANPINDGELDGYDVYLLALSESDYPEESMLKPLDQVVKEFSEPGPNKTDLFLKTTRAGKAIIITAPIVAAFTLLWALTALLLMLVKKVNSQKQL